MNSIGKIFRAQIFGESHGEGVGVVIDGCPPGLGISEEIIESETARRRSGAKGTTERKEPDKPKIMSGVYKGRSTGAPITIFFANEDAKSEDYGEIRKTPRPGHADFTAYKKYKGINDPQGGGAFSGRMTVALVAAGAIAKKIIEPIEINAEILEVGGSKNIDEAVEAAIEEKDSVGGVVECVARNVPVGLGEPFFDSVESAVSHIIFAIPAIKAIEFGSGFAAARMKGSEHNDAIINIDGETETNNAGGINGGITNGNDIIFRVAVKPTSSIGKPQRTVNLETSAPETIKLEGRHDACIALRTPPIIEAAAAIALADLKLSH